MRHFLIAALILTSAGYALADDGLVSKQSKYSVSETMDRLEAAVKSNGPRIYARIDFRESSKNNVRPSQLLIFGDGTLLPAFLNAAPKAGIDLPIKILVWEDEHGVVWVTYNAGEYVATRHDAKNVSEAARRFTAGGERFAKMATE
jgi:uncharacterized protein (DUF302 family)